MVAQTPSQADPQEDGDDEDVVSRNTMELNEVKYVTADGMRIE